MNPLNSKWFSLLLIILVGCLVFLLLGMSARRAEFEQAVSDSEQRVAVAKRDKAYIEKFIAYFKSPAFLEKQARMKLNYKSPDEEVAFIFRDPNSKPEADTGDWLEREPNYRKWWYYILGH
jgi:cell division protein FtsB